MEMIQLSCFQKIYLTISIMRFSKIIIISKLYIKRRLIQTENFQNVQNDILAEIDRSEQNVMNEDKIKLMLSKEENCLRRHKGHQNTKVATIDLGQIHFGEVLRNLDYLSDNIVKYINVPKIIKKPNKK